jgi:hypothetical protein
MVDVAEILSRHFPNFRGQRHYRLGHEDSSIHSAYQRIFPWLFSLCLHNCAKPVVCDHFNYQEFNQSFVSWNTLTFSALRWIFEEYFGAVRRADEGRNKREAERRRTSLGRCERSRWAEPRRKLEHRPDTVSTGELVTRHQPQCQGRELNWSVGTGYFSPSNPSNMHLCKENFQNMHTKVYTKY